MKLNEEKKKAIISYILEKISQGTRNVSSIVADALSISTNTVHNYLNDLQDSGVIRKIKRGEYELITERSEYTFKRSAGELISDTVAYDVCLNPIADRLNENTRHIWEYALSEMVNNVIDHSDGNSQLS